MLTNLTNVLAYAKKNQCAVGSFNTPNLESILAVIGAAEELNQPVILMHAQIHEEMKLARLDVIGRIMVMSAEQAKIPVCVHLDHGTDVEYLKRALDLGFTSVMYDGSLEAYAINRDNTRKTVEIAGQYGASVEAEIGSLGSRESGGTDSESIYTDPEDAVKFVADTGINALACAFGTAHGIYLKKPQLDFPRLAKIHSLIDIPLVMHGGSGVSHEDYRRAISHGIRKINYYTYMAKAGGEGVRAMPDATFFHDIAVAAEATMKQDALNAMKVFSGK